MLFFMGFIVQTQAQKLNVTETKMPLTKKANKFSAYGGTFWDTDKGTLRTFYLYSEKKDSPLKFQEIPFSASGEIGKPVDDYFSIENLSQYNVEVDEKITNPEKFTSFDKEMIWFKHSSIGLNGVAYEGGFEPQYSSRFFPGYEFEKSSDRILLMGKGNQAINLAFVESSVEQIDGYTAQMETGYFEGWSSMAYVPKGETAIVGGLVNGRVKIGLNASEDWLRYRFMVGSFNTNTMQFDSQRFYEYDYSLTMMTWLKTDEHNAVLFGLYPKGVIQNNRVRFPNKELQGMMLLVFDKSGNKVSETVINVDPKVQLPETIEIGNDGAGLTYLDGAYYIMMHTAEGKYGSGVMENVNLVKVLNGKVVYNSLIPMSEIENKKVTASAEKVKKYNKRGTSIEVETMVKTPTNDLLVFGKFLMAGNQKIILQIDDKTGALKRNFMSETLEGKSAVKIPIGARGWAKQKVAHEKDEAYYDFNTSIILSGDDVYVLYRTQTGDMRMGAGFSRTNTSGYVQTTKMVSISEYYTYAKLFKINLVTGSMSEPVMMDKEVAVGLDPMFVSEDGAAFIHGYNGKNYTMTTVR